jgi:hypothetical protein
MIKGIVALGLLGTAGSPMTRVRRSLMLAAWLAVGGLLSAACDNAGTSTALDRPTTAPASLMSFNGTLKPLATDTYLFTVAQDGYVQVTLIGLSAPNGTQVKLGVGTPGVDGLCATDHTVVTTAGPSAQIVGTGLAGRLCVTITDVGNLIDPALYTITVASS